MKREAAEADWQQRFNDKGLSEHFELIKREWTIDHGRKVWVKCKECGAVFLTYSVLMVLLGRQNDISCPECGMKSDGTQILIRSELCDEIASYYVEGHSVSETAKKFGVPKGQVNNIAKKRHLTNGQDFRVSAIKNQKEKAELRLKEIPSKGR